MHTGDPNLACHTCLAAVLWHALASPLLHVRQVLWGEWRRVPGWPLNLAPLPPSCAQLAKDAKKAAQAAAPAPAAAAARPFSGKAAGHDSAGPHVAHGADGAAQVVISRG